REGLAGEQPAAGAILPGQREGRMLLVGDDDLVAWLPLQAAQDVVDAIGGVAPKGQPGGRHVEDAGHRRPRPLVGGYVLRGIAQVAVLSRQGDQLQIAVEYGPRRQAVRGHVEIGHLVERGEGAAHRGETVPLCAAHRRWVYFLTYILSIQSSVC